MSGTDENHRCTATVDVDDITYRCKLHHSQGDLNHIAQHPIGLLAWPAEPGEIAAATEPAGQRRQDLLDLWEACDYAPVFDQDVDGNAPDAQQARRDLMHAIAQTQRDRRDDPAGLRETCGWVNLLRAATDNDLTTTFDLTRSYA